MRLNYRVQQPKSLESFAMEVLGSWVASQAEKLLSPALKLHQYYPTRAEQLISRQIEVTRNHLKRNLPWKFHDTLAIEVMQALLKLRRSLNSGIQLLNLDPNIQTDAIGRMIEVIFTRNLTCLSFCTIDEQATDSFFYSFRASLFSKSYMLTGLTRLNLLHVGESDVVRLLKNLYNLKHLSLGGCTHNIIKCLADNCKLIEDLESCFDINLNENSINILLQLPNLRSVSLIRSSLRRMGIEALLLSSRNLEIKISIQSGQLQLALEHIVPFEEHSGKQFNLKYYINSPQTTLQQLQLVVQTCPRIDEMELFKFDNGNNIPNVLPLIDLRHLRELKLHNFDFYAGQLGQFLQVRGCHLVNLHFDNLSGIDLNALLCLGQTCQNLECLSFNDCIFEKESRAYLFKIKDRLESTSFTKLKRFSLETRNKPTKSQLFFLLSSCPNVEFISIIPILISEAFMLNVLDRNPLIHLQEFKCVYRKDKANVAQVQPRPTLLFIDRIIQNCINPPKITLISLYCY